MYRKSKINTKVKIRKVLNYINGINAYLSAILDLGDNISTTQSMSRVGKCIDNGQMEGFLGTLKSEMCY